MECNQTITSPAGDYDFLDNTFESPMIYKGLPYCNAAAAYQAQKCPGSEHCFFLSKGEEAIADGRSMERIQEGWSFKKEGEMYRILYEKFCQSPKLLERLLNTEGSEIVYENKNDTFWGKVGEEGENKLGKILMSIRKTFLDLGNALLLSINWHENEMKKTICISAIGAGISEPKEFYLNLSSFMKYGREAFFVSGEKIKDILSNMEILSFGKVKYVLMKSFYRKKKHGRCKLVSSDVIGSFDDMFTARAVMSEEFCETVTPEGDSPEEIRQWLIEGNPQKLIKKGRANFGYSSAWYFEEKEKMGVWFYLVGLVLPPC